MPVNPYLQACETIDFNEASVAAQAALLAEGCRSDTQIAASCFHFVRDQIRHSKDFSQNPVTCKASDVLHHATGYCYAKSHLLAALLRANGIPAGLCYQRLSLGTGGAPYCLHGLNAVYLADHGWYRIDARGNKPGVQAEFCPPREQLAFALKEDNEADLPEIWPEPLPCVLRVLHGFDTVDAVYAHLPDIALMPKRH